VFLILASNTKHCGTCNEQTWEVQTQTNYALNFPYIFGSIQQIKPNGAKWYYPISTNGIYFFKSCIFSMSLRTTRPTRLFASIIMLIVDFYYHKRHHAVSNQQVKYSK
jgi:hypothetical protein